jgi:STE24 endopeptidase
MNLYLVAILTVLVLTFVLDLVVDWRNVRHVSAELPEEFRGVYDAAKYARSQEYLRANTRFGLWQECLTTPALIAFILLGGFAWLDGLAWQWGGSERWAGQVFLSLLIVGGVLLSLPFGAYQTFGIEERFGFNKTTPKTFVLDQVKALGLGLVIANLVLFVVVFFFQHTGGWGWLAVWAAVTAIQLFGVYIAPVLIMPLFNKFTPLPEGELRTAIESYAREQGFRLSGIFTMDGSKRSTKANAYFTGLGRTKRIVLFDTLVAQHTVPELVAILAHEMGHYRLRHIPRMLAVHIGTTGLLFFLLSLFLRNEQLFAAFGIPPERVSIYGSLVFFGFLFTPVSLLLGIAGNALSRRHEFEADAYAARTTGQAEAMIAALKKLSVETLANLTPHPWKVTLSYTHPPVLQRVLALRRVAAETVSAPASQ